MLGYAGCHKMPNADHQAPVLALQHTHPRQRLMGPDLVYLSQAWVIKPSVEPSTYGKRAGLHRELIPCAAVTMHSDAYGPLLGRVRDEADTRQCAPQPVLPVFHPGEALLKRSNRRNRTSANQGTLDDHDVAVDERAEEGIQRGRTRRR